MLCEFIISLFTLPIEVREKFLSWFLFSFCKKLQEISAMQPLQWKQLRIMKSDCKLICGFAINVLITSCVERGRKRLNMFVYSGVRCNYIPWFVGTRFSIHLPASHNSSCFLPILIRRKNNGIRFRDSRL